MATLATKFLRTRARHYSSLFTLPEGPEDERRVTTSLIIDVVTRC